MPPSADLDLDAELLGFLLSERPPLELGSMPPPAILASVPPASKARFAPAPAPDDSRVERVDARHVGLPAAVPAAPPAPPPRSPIVRARKLVKVFETTGPGDEAPTVQALLAIGPEALPAVAAAFPGLLWFDRRLPHSKVPRGRDVSPVARTLVAFGEAAREAVGPLLAAEHADMRFYALLVAQDIGAQLFVEPIGELALDRDEGVRAIATAALSSLDPTSTASVRARLRERVGGPDRDACLHAIRALVRLRDVEVIPALIALLEPFDPELWELSARGLAALTGRSFGTDGPRWQRWYAAEGKRARAEWLLDALETAGDDMADFVLHELASISGRTFEPAPDGRARKRAAKSYRAWWKASRAT